MQTSEEGVQQTELKSSPSNPFKNPQQTQPQSVYPQHYHSASIDSGPTGGEDKFASWGNFKTWMIRWRGSRRLVLVIVAIALLLDNMLLTVVGELEERNFYFVCTCNKLNECSMSYGRCGRGFNSWLEAYF